jgi:hypothetical protein
MNTEETPATAVVPLLVLGDAGADTCADGFCAVSPARLEETGQEQTGMGE